MLKEEETRTKAAEFETRVTSSLKGLETSLGLVQHKVWGLLDRVREGCHDATSVRPEQLKVVVCSQAAVHMRCLLQYVHGWLSSDCVRISNSARGDMTDAGRSAGGGGAGAAVPQPLCFWHTG